LKTAIREFIATYDTTPKPFTWTKTADEILATIARFPQRTLDSDRATYSANHAVRILAFYEPSLRTVFGPYNHDGPA